VLACAAILTGSADQAAQQRLITTVNAIQRTHHDRTTAGFASFTLDQLRAQVHTLGVVQGGSNLVRAKPGPVAVALCATGPRCNGAVMATRGANDTCWYAALAYSPDSARVLGFDPGIIGLQYGVTTHEARCTAGGNGHLPRPTSGWREDLPPTPS
jgi:hypothetical protein